MNSYILLSPAKINLYLKIVGKRDDGFHLLESLVQKISLFDTIKITSAKYDRIIFYSTEHIPEENTVKKALYEFKSKINSNKMFNIKIYKNIPTGAGLGGGSSNAARILKFLNYYHGNLFSFNELLNLGKKIGADVPLFLSKEKQLIMKGIGDKLFPVPHHINYWILLVKPDFSISTAWAYKNLNFELTNKIKSINRGCSKISEFVNDLEKPVIKKYQEIKRLKEKLLESGAEISLMTGSGSTVFGLFKEKSRAQKALTYIKNYKKNYRYYIVKSL